MRLSCLTCRPAAPVPRSLLLACLSVTIPGSQACITVRSGTYDELLAPPSGDDAAAPTGTIERCSAAYVSKDERFLLKGRQYDRQYSQLYFYRLLQMRKHVQAAAKRAWPDAQGAAQLLCLLG